MTHYKMSLQLNEFDMANIDRIAAHTGHSRATALHLALGFCDISLTRAKSGYMTSVIYDSNCRTTSTISHRDVAARYNSRNPNAEKMTVLILRSTQTLEHLQTIKNGIGVTSDDVAVAFALEYSATAIRQLQNAANGKPARIFFTTSNHPGKTGYTLVKHPFDINLGNRFRRAARKLKSAIVQPFQKKTPAAPALPAPAPAPAPAVPAPETSAPEESSFEAMKPLKLKKPDNGFRL